MDRDPSRRRMVIRCPDCDYPTRATTRSHEDYSASMTIECETPQKPFPGVLRQLKSRCPQEPLIQLDRRSANLAVNILCGIWDIAATEPNIVRSIGRSRWQNGWVANDL